MQDTPPANIPESRVSKERCISVHFSTAPNELLYDLEVSSQALRLWMILWDIADNRTRKCFPGVAYLSTKLGLEKKQVHRKLNELADTGWLDWIPRRHKESVLQSSNDYFFYDKKLNKEEIARLRNIRSLRQNKNKKTRKFIELCGHSSEGQKCPTVRGSKMSPVNEGQKCPS